jgi:hypothetical protein
MDCGNAIIAFQWNEASRWGMCSDAGQIYGKDFLYNSYIRVDQVDAEYCHVIFDLWNTVIEEFYGMTESQKGKQLYQVKRDSAFRQIVIVM